MLAQKNHRSNYFQRNQTLETFFRIRDDKLNFFHLFDLAVLK